MRKIGIPEIEDIALGAALLGAGGGGDPYVGKLVAIGAVQECGPVTMLDPEEVPDDALVVPIAMMGAPTVLCEKAIGGEEYKTLYETVSAFYGKPIYAFMPIEAGGVNSMLPIAAAARLGLPLVDCDGMGRAFPELQMVTFTIGGGSATPMAMVDEKGNSCIFRTVTNKWTEEMARAVTMACGGSVSVSLYAMEGKFMKEYGVIPEAWAPFNEGKRDFFRNPVLTEIGQKYGKTAAQVALRWNIQRGAVVIPKSVHEERIRQNFDVFDFALTEDDMAKIKTMDLGHSEIVDHFDPQWVKFLHSLKV